MSVSSSNRERLAAMGNGTGGDDVNVDKENPDRSNGKAEAENMSAARPHGHVNRLPGEKTDEELLAAYREGNRPSFAALVERYQRELFHFLVRFLGDRAAAEDIFQETFLQVHQSADQFDLQRRFRPWLFTIAANKARDLMRSQARRPTNPLQASINPGDDDSGEFMDLMSSSDAFPGEPMEKAELQQSVQKAVMGMPDHLREILLL